MQRTKKELNGGNKRLLEIKGENRRQVNGESRERQNRSLDTIENPSKPSNSSVKRNMHTRGLAEYDGDSKFKTLNVFWIAS